MGRPLTRNCTLVIVPSLSAAEAVTVAASATVVALTTSGKSENVNRGLRAAHLRGAVTIALTGEAGLVGAEADHVIAVPSSDSAVVQEIHLVIIHLFCLAVEEIG